MSGTVTLHRVLQCAPEKVYKAFTIADALARWIPPHGFTCTVEHLDARVGGTHKAFFTNFSTGHRHSFGGTYLELVPGELIRYNDQFDDPSLPGEMLVTIQMKEVANGTDLRIVQEGIPDSIPVEFCYVGWQQSLEYLAHLVEPNIPD